MLTARIDPPIMMMAGLLLQGFGGYQMMLFDLNVDETSLAIWSVVQGSGIGVTWVPVTIVTFFTLRQELRAEGMSMYHLIRNFGSSQRRTYSSRARSPGTAWILPYPRLKRIRLEGHIETDQLSKADNAEPPQQVLQYAIRKISIISAGVPISRGLENVQSSSMQFSASC